MFDLYFCRNLSRRRDFCSFDKRFCKLVFVTLWCITISLSKGTEEGTSTIGINASSSDTPVLINKSTKEDETRSHAAWVFLPENKVRTASSGQIKSVQLVPKRRDEAMINPWNADRNHDEESSDGTTKVPGCAQYGRYYCTHKEDYPVEVVNQVIKYMKTPLEKLFRDLRGQKMPKIADNAEGSLVCDSITRIVRPGWAKNNNAKWVVVINTEMYQQHVTEVVCRYDNSYCNFVPPCYQASCQQRYNIQILLVIDPYNPYKGPFLSKFLFPSCCVCYVPKMGSDKNQDDY